MEKSDNTNDKQETSAEITLNNMQNTEDTVFIEDKDDNFDKLCQKMRKRIDEIQKQADEIGLFPWPKELADESAECSKTIYEEFKKIAGGEPEFEHQIVQIGKHTGIARYFGSPKELKWLIQ